MSKFEFKSKADTLLCLKDRLKSVRILPAVVLTVEQWHSDGAACLRNILEILGNSTLVVRSSCSAEDTIDKSNAGKFESILNVDSTNEAAVVKAVEAVIESYSILGSIEKEQILIQPQLVDVDVSGVCLTRILGTGAPYYLVNYANFDTSAVTSGGKSKAIYISHQVPRPINQPWENLIIAAEELVQVTGLDALDIEFAITSKQEVVLFQVRPMVKMNTSGSVDQLCQENLSNCAKRFERFSRPLPHLGGDRTILGDMPDWNPAEIIGDRPHSLAYSIYSFIIMDNVWHQARTLLGYYDVSPGDLMVSIGLKPYVDVRLSFNSLTPATMSHQLRHKLVNYYLDLLERHPERQDKVEFEILWTCFDFSLNKELGLLLKEGFTDREIEEVGNCLKSLTDGIFRSFREIKDRADQAISQLTERRNLVLSKLDYEIASVPELFQAAYILLENCKSNGTLWFAVMARMGFIGRSIFYSLVETGDLSKDRVDAFLSTIATVATDFCEQLTGLEDGKTDLNEFLVNFGHLRPGSYDICAPRYDQIYGRVQDVFPKPQFIHKSNPKQSSFRFTAEEVSAVNSRLRQYGFNVDLEFLADFCVIATQNREGLKFDFTRNLSDALELIALAGKKLGLTRQEVQDLNFRSVLRYRNPEVQDLNAIKKSVLIEIASNCARRQKNSILKLPAVLTKSDDLYFWHEYIARPNFVTKKQITGPIVYGDTAQELLEKSCEGAIVIIENADPGYDWIFSRSPAALITKYGGAASHMAIRCTEFGLPAAIGVGEKIFDTCRSASSLLLDCERGEFLPLS